MTHHTNPARAPAGRAVAFRLGSGLAVLVISVAVLAMLAGAIQARGADAAAAREEARTETVFGFQGVAREAELEAWQSFARGRVELSPAAMLRLLATLDRVEDFFQERARLGRREEAAIARANLEILADGRAVVERIRGGRWTAEGSPGLLRYALDASSRWFAGYRDYLALSRARAAAFHAEATAAQRRAFAAAAIAILVGALLGGVLLLRLREGRRRHLGHLSWLAATDPLTGLGNRRELHRLLEGAVARAHEDGGPLSVAIIDLDHFKRVNDQHGHHTGDAVLIEAARRLEAAAGGAPIARFGGEEFVVLLAGAPERDAIGAAERLRRAIGDRAFGTSGRTTASAGVATRGASGDAERLLREADAALYLAKRRGRDVTVHFSRTAAGAANPLGARDRGRRDRRTREVAATAAGLAALAGWRPAAIARLREAALRSDPVSPGRAPGWFATTVTHGLDAEQHGWIRHRGEWWSGAGGPAGLRGEEIPEGARMIAIAEAWQAAWRNGRETAGAVRRCRDAAGDRLWPAGVEMLEALVESGPRTTGPATPQTASSEANQT